MRTTNRIQEVINSLKETNCIETSIKSLNLSKELFNKYKQESKRLAALVDKINKEAVSKILMNLFNEALKNNCNEKQNY